MLSKFGLWLVLAILPFSFALNPFSGIDLQIIRLLIPALFIIWLVESLKNKNFLIDRRPRFWLLAIFFFLILLSYLWAIDESRATRKILFFASLLPLYFPVYSVSSSIKNRDFLLKIIYWPSAVAAIFGLLLFFLQFFWGIDKVYEFIAGTTAPIFLGNSFGKTVLDYPSWLVNISGNNFLRTFGSFPDPHLFALYLNMTIWIGCYLFQNARNSLKNIYLISTLLVLTALLLSFSRAAYFSLIVGAFTFFLFSDPLKIVKQKTALILFAVIALISIFIIPSPLSDRLLSSFDSKDGSNIGRIEMWKKGFETTLDHPSTGVGIGNFSRYIKPSSTYREPIYAHNLFLDFSSETGLASAIILLLILLCPIMYYVYSRILVSKYIAVSLVAFIIHSIFETPVYSVNVFPLLVSLLALNLKK